MRANIYIDGFNTYYGIRRFPGSKWLDVSALAQRLIPGGFEVRRIRYFTAHVTAWPTDPGQPVRQQMYLRALETIPDLTIHYGQFKTREKEMPLVDQPDPTKIRKANVWKTEEKGSDVNLASFLLLDAFQNDYDLAVVISNDSDLAKPVEFVQDPLGKRVGIANPHPPKKRSLELQGSYFRQIRGKQVRDCQFPESLSDGIGTFTRPSAWSQKS